MSENGHTYRPTLATRTSAIAEARRTVVQDALASRAQAARAMSVCHSFSSR
jgi:hypothetical protein